MDADDLSLSFVSLGLLYPERPRFEGNHLPNLYAELTKRHAFQSFQHDQESAVMHEEGQRTLTVHRSALIAEMSVGQSVELVTRELVDIVEIVRQHLQIPIFWEPRIVLRALKDVKDGAEDEDLPAGIAAMMRSAVSVSGEQLALLRPIGIDGLTLGVELNDEHEGHPRHVSVEVGTYARDRDQLYIELTIVQHRQLEDTSELELWIPSQHGHFISDVLPFAGSITRPDRNSR